MTLTTIHSVDKGIYRLLNAPKDIKVACDFDEQNKTFAQASSEYKNCYKEYLREFTEVYDVARAWWEATLEGIMENENLPREKAAENAIFERMAGPAAIPDFVWLIRKYWLECDDINRKKQIENRVRPEIFLLQWLIDDSKSDWVKLITSMPYWPIGIDDDSEWC